MLRSSKICYNFQVCNTRINIEMMSGCYQPPYTPTVTSSAHIRESPKFLFPPRSTWIAFLIYPLLYSVRILTWNWSWENSNLCYFAQWNNRDSPRVLIGQKLMICYTEKPILYHDSWWILRKERANVDQCIKNHILYLQTYDPHVISIYQYCKEFIFGYLR